MFKSAETWTSSFKSRRKICKWKGDKLCGKRGWFHLCNFSSAGLFLRGQEFCELKAQVDSSYLGQSLSYTPWRNAHSNHIPLSSPQCTITHQTPAALSHLWLIRSMQYGTHQLIALCRPVGLITVLIASMKQQWPLWFVGFLFCNGFLLFLLLYHMI